MSKYKEAEEDALKRFPDCKFARATNGLTPFLQLTIVVEMWRNEECWAAGDPPRRVVEGYPASEGGVGDERNNL